MQNQKLEVVGDKVKASIVDQTGYVMAIDFFKISEVLRISFSVVPAELTLVLKETVGRIGEEVVPIESRSGKEKGKKRELGGTITSFKVVMSDKEEILKFLKVWLNEPEITPAIFNGFEEHDKAKKYIDDAIARKKAEKPSGIVAPDGSPAKS